MPKRNPEREARLAAALRENLRKRKAGKTTPATIADENHRDPDPA